MIGKADNQFRESDSPHSMGLQNNMTVPSPGLDSMYGVGADKLWSGNQVGLRGLVDDPIGWLSEEMIQGIPNWGLVLGAIGVWWLMTPHGEDYRRERSQLRKKHRGYSKVSKFLSVDEPSVSRGKPSRADVH